MLAAIEWCQRCVVALEGDAGIAKKEEGAIERNLQTICWALNQLPPEFTATHPEISWPQIRGFRNIL